MNRRYVSFGTLVISSLFLMLFLIFNVNYIEAYAGELTVSGPNADGTYYYNYKSGQFETNIEEGKTAEVAYIEWDDSLSISLMKDGVSLSYASGDIIFLSGKYIALIYDNESGEFTTFEFYISNSLGGNGGMGNKQENTGSVSEGSIFDSIGDSYGLEIFDQFSTDEAIPADYDSDKVGVLNLKCSFDEENLRLIYEAAGQEIFISDIPNNAYVSSSKGAMVKSGSGSVMYVLKDGNMILAPSDNIFKEPGFYQIKSYVINPSEELLSDDELVDGAYVYEATFSFNVIPDRFNNIGVITPPEGFYYDSISFNGNKVDLPKGLYFYLEEDGMYSFSFVSKGNNVTYEFSFIKDTVAPIITINQPVEKNIVKNQLSFDVDDEDAVVAVYLNGERMNFTAGMTTYDPGWYRFVARDIAGNEREINVYLSVSHQFFSRGMIISFVILLFALVAFIFNVRRGKYTVS